MDSSKIKIGMRFSLKECPDKLKNLSKIGFYEKHPHISWILKQKSFAVSSIRDNNNFCGKPVVWFDCNGNDYCYFLQNMVVFENENEDLGPQHPIAKVFQLDKNERIKYNLDKPKIEAKLMKTV